MNLKSSSLLCLSLLLLAACAKSGMPSEEEARETIYSHLESIRERNFEAYSRFNKIKEEHKREFFDAEVAADTLCREIISKFGTEGLQRYVSATFGDFTKLIKITDTDLLEAKAGGIEIYEEDGYRMVDTYPIGIYVITKNRDGSCVVNTDIVVADYDKFFNVVVRPGYKNTKEALKLLQTREYETAREFVIDVSNHVEKLHANQSEVSTPLAPASLTP